MAYTPDPTDPTAPLDTEKANTAAAEFRALKLMLKNSIVLAIGAGGVHAGDATPFNPLAAGATEVIDTLGEFAAGIFTAAQTGYYDVSVDLHFQSQTANSSILTMSIYKNGTALYQRIATCSANTTIVLMSFRRLIHLVAGDTLNMELLAGVPTAVSISSPVLCINSIQKG